MRFKLPSPSMIVAIIAVILALSGSAVAAVSFATNSGAVDGKSAVADGALLRQSAGKLVATQRTGPGAGRIRAKYLDGVARGQTAAFGRLFDVADNQTVAPATVSTLPGLGTITATCNDQRPQPGIEDPSTTIAFANSSGNTVNLSKRVGNGAGAVEPVINNVQSTVLITGSNTFEFMLQNANAIAVVHGTVRQDAPGTAAAQCLIYGYSLQIPNA